MVEEMNKARKLAKKNIDSLMYNPEQYQFGIAKIDRQPKLKSFILGQIEKKGLHHGRFNKEVE